MTIVILGAVLSLAGIINVFATQNRLLPKKTLQGLTDQNRLLGNSSLDTLGPSSFPSPIRRSCRNFLKKGVALLHSFWYDEARKRFEWISQQDQHCSDVTKAAGGRGAANPAEAFAETIGPNGPHRAEQAAAADAEISPN